jgi:hypothetical protein
MEQLLKLGLGNAKLKNDVAILDLVAGKTCPFAKDCAESVDRFTGKLNKNPKAKFRCFAATSELISSAARRKRWHNFDLLKNCNSSNEMAELIINSINSNNKTKIAPKVRVHSSGDFFNQKYFNAWMTVAKSMPEKIFYAYTKSLKFWVAKLNEIPENFNLTASRGGKTDSLIEKHNLKNTVIVFSEAEAKLKGLEIDHDDSHCYDKNCKAFALLLHGTQPANSIASKAIQAMHKEGIMGYQRGVIGKGRKAA